MQVLPDGTIAPDPEPVLPGSFTDPFAAFIQAIGADPVYQEAVRNRDLHVQAGKNAFRDWIRQAVLKSGINPTKFLKEKANTARAAGDLTTAQEYDDYAAYIDSGTTEAAAANPLSDVAKLLGTKQHGQHNLRYLLASRGLTGSGAEASGEGVLGQRYDTGYAGLSDSLLGGIGTQGGALSGLETSEGNILTGIKSDVATRLANTPGAVTGTGNTAEDTVDENGNPLPGCLVGPGATVPMGPQPVKPRVNPATTAVIKRSRELAKAYKKTPKAFR